MDAINTHVSFTTVKKYYIEILKQGIYSNKTSD